MKIIPLFWNFHCVAELTLRGALSTTKTNNEVVEIKQLSKVHESKQ